MARAQSTDFISNARFQLVATSGDGTPRLVRPPNTVAASQAGFSQSSVPDATTDTKMYREGTFVYTRKFPGIPTIGDITVQRGLARLDTSLWDWMRVVIEGSGEYRADVDLKVFHRDTALNREFPTTGSVPNKTEINTDFPAVVYHLQEAFPSRVKPGGDLDASSGEISIQEMVISQEHFEVEHFAAP